MLVTGYPMMLDQNEAEQVTGYRPLPAELFDHLPLGRRIIVVREKPRERHGLIIVPEKSRAPRTSGWVIAAGPDIGLPNTLTAAAGRWPWPPVTILGAQIVFPFYSGAPFCGELDDPMAAWVVEAGGAATVQDDTMCPFRLMADTEILTVIRNSLPRGEEPQ